MTEPTESSPNWPPNPGDTIRWHDLPVEFVSAASPPWWTIRFPDGSGQSALIKNCTPYTPPDEVEWEVVTNSEGRPLGRCSINPHIDHWQGDHAEDGGEPCTDWRPVALRRPAHQCDTDGEPKMVELPGWYRLNVDARTVRAWQSDMDKEYGTRTGKWSRHYHPVPTCSVCGEAMEVGE